MENRTLIQKADLALGDLQTDGGYLQEEQAKRFFEIMIKNATMVPLMTFNAMKSHTAEVGKLNFPERILRVGQSATPLTLGERAKPVTDKREMTARLFRAEVRIDDETLEDNVEGKRFSAHIMKLIAKRIASDIDDIVLNSDTASLTPELAQFDGLRKLITTNLVVAGGVPMDEDTLRDMLKTMPQEFKANKRDMRYLTSDRAEIDYRHSLGGRGTDHGDSHLGSLNAGDPTSTHYAGIRVLPLTYMPENLGGGTNETEIILCNPKAAIFGMWRKVKVETWRDAPAGTNSFIVSTRFTTQWEHEPATVKATGITVS